MKLLQSYSGRLKAQRGYGGGNPVSGVSEYLPFAEWLMPDYRPRPIMMASSISDGLYLPE